MKNRITVFKHWFFLNPEKEEKKAKHSLVRNCKRYYFDERVPAIYFTRKEMECMDGFFRGRTTKEIGYDLNISPRTVAEHFADMRKKFKCHTCLELAGLVVQNDYLSKVDFLYQTYEERLQAEKQVFSRFSS